MRNIKLTNREYHDLMFYLLQSLGQEENKAIRDIFDNKLIGCKCTSR